MFTSNVKIKEQILFDNCCNFSTFALYFLGELSEWFKERAWKVRIPQKGIESSNLSLSAHLSLSLANPHHLFF